MLHNDTKDKITEVEKNVKCGPPLPKVSTTLERTFFGLRNNDISI